MGVREGTAWKYSCPPQLGTKPCPKLPPCVTNLSGLAPGNNSGFPFLQNIAPTGGRCWARGVLPTSRGGCRTWYSQHRKSRRQSVSRVTEGAVLDGLEGGGRGEVRGGVRLNWGSGLGQLPDSSDTGAEPDGAGPDEG